MSLLALLLGAISLPGGRPETSAFLPLVLEGVETVEQEAYLRGAGVDYAQGWLYAKALAPKEFIDFYDRRNSGERASD